MEIDGIKVLYTGDYSIEQDRLIMPAEIPTEQIDILITESTYGNIEHDPRPQRERIFLEDIKRVVRERNGKCLLPVLALGRGEELLTLLEEYWEEHPEMHDIPIYYTTLLYQ